MVATPKRNRVECLSQERRRELRNHLPIIPQFLGRTNRQRVRPGQSRLLPFQCRLRAGLRWHEQPLKSLADSTRGGSVPRRFLCRRLARLRFVEVQLRLLVNDGLPCKIITRGLLQLVESAAVGSQKDKRILINTRTIAPLCKKFLCGFERKIRSLARIGFFHIQYHEPHLHLVRHIAGIRRERVYPWKLSARTQILTHASANFFPNSVRFAPQLFGSVIRQLGDCRLRRIPVACVVLI